MADGRWPMADGRSPIAGQWEVSWVGDGWAFVLAIRASC
jgi:hypothetical protein